MRICTVKATPVWGIALWKSLWEFKGHIKVGGIGEGTGEVIR